MNGKQILVAILGVTWGFVALILGIYTNGTIRETHCVDSGGSYVLIDNTEYKECVR